MGALASPRIFKKNFGNARRTVHSNHQHHDHHYQQHPCFLVFFYMITKPCEITAKTAKIQPQAMKTLPDNSENCDFKPPETTCPHRSTAPRGGEDEIGTRRDVCRCAPCYQRVFFPLATRKVCSPPWLITPAIL